MPSAAVPFFRSCLWWHCFFFFTSLVLRLLSHSFFRRISSTRHLHVSRPHAKPHVCVCGGRGSPPVFTDIRRKATVHQTERRSRPVGGPAHRLRASCVRLRVCLGFTPPFLLVRTVSRWLNRGMGEPGVAVGGGDAQGRGRLRQRGRDTTRIDAWTATWTSLRR